MTIGELRAILAELCDRDERWADATVLVCDQVGDDFDLRVRGNRIRTEVRLHTASENSEMPWLVVED